MEKVKYPEPGGKYRHYKGGVYEFLFMAPHSENGDKLVIYKSILFGSYHARPLDNWNSNVESGKKRFKSIS
jgi:hypothetical protein